MSNTRPRVSIGMPVYNGDRFLKEALNSILAQTFKDFELIVSDNGSTDTTQEICSAYAAMDPRIQYYRNEKNLGASWNQNRVFHLSKGEYFKWAHHDDMSAPTLLERSVQVLDCNPSVVLCYPQTSIVDEQGQRIEEFCDDFDLSSSKPHERFERYHNLVRYGHRCHPVLGMIRADILKTTPLMGSYPSSDLVLLGELALHGKFCEIPEHLFFKRDHPYRSMRVHPTFRERIAWFDPAKKGQLHLTRWQWFFEYLGGIERVQMDRSEKVRCYIQMAKWFTWNWVWLAKDLIKAVAWPFLQPFLKFESSRQARKKLPSLTVKP